MENGQKTFKILQVKSHFLCTLGGQKYWLARLARLARLDIFLRGWRLTLRVKYRGWRGAARLAETSNCDGVMSCLTSNDHTISSQP